MLNFELFWIFYLLPLPILAYWLLPKAKQQQAAVRVPFFNQLNNMQHTPTHNLNQRRIKLSAVLLLWCSLIAAAAGPLWIGDPITLPTTGRDLLLAVDLSGSMLETDMVVNGEQIPRINAVKVVLNEFIERRKGDRLGLILFGTNAYVQAPLTFDRTTVKSFLMEAQIGFAGQEQTAIGDAIGLSVKRLRNRPGDRHVVILLTDGVNNGGAVEPIAAAKLAAQENIIIYTVGIGADKMVQPGIFGSSFGSRTVNPSADLDEATLKEIAQLTGGEYFRARNPAELINIYQLLDKLEPIEDEEKTFRPQKSLFYWPLSIAAIISLLIATSYLPWLNWYDAIRVQPSSSKKTTEGLS
jgi:Ca-activated chloride channel family protein